LFDGGSAALVKKELLEEAPRGESAEDEKEQEAAQKTQDLETTDIFSSQKYFIEINAAPPGKKIKGIQMLSGGEKALTAIALICGIIYCNPSPFIILDEVDAALDETNSIKFSNIIKELSQQSQFIIITHNRATMENASLLYGVTMGEDGVSKILSVNLSEAEKIVK
jgi:chromosome segregation protein